MFKHLLLPTDGSAASERAIRQGLALAKEQGAQVTGLHVIQPFTVFAYDIQMVETTDAAYMAQARERAERYVKAIDKAAQELGVACKTQVVIDEHPHAAIVRTAVVGRRMAARPSRSPSACAADRARSDTQRPSAPVQRRLSSRAGSRRRLPAAPNEGRSRPAAPRR